MLGPLEVQSADGWTAISAAKWRQLLACLLLRSGQLVPTDSLILELWGDVPPSTANNLVSIYVHRLKKVIGDTEGKMLVYRAPGYVLRVGPGDVDIEHFESLAADGRTALAAADAERASALLGEALRLWRGPLLADVPPSPLIASRADRMAELWLTVTELRVEADIACGRAVQAVPGLRGLVTEHPLRERLWALLMRALEAAGRRAEALEIYAQARQVIADELGVDPGSELQRLYADLLAADASAVAPAPSVPQRPRRPSRPGQRPAPLEPDDDALAAVVAGAIAESRTAGVPREAAGASDVESGEPPSGEIGGAIAIGTFADPSAASAAQQADGMAHVPLAARPTQLPADIADFTGRETHVDHLCGLLLGGNAARSPGAVRVVVVNGAAGLGKTALAVHAAHQVSQQFPDGQLYVDLLGASSQPASPGEVLARFLRDLGIEGDKVPAKDDERAALYRTTLTGRRVLILLDNAKDAAQVRSLLPGSSSCAVLVTTRNRTSDLASTRFLDLNVLEDTEALALFARIVGEERAAAEPDATAEILVACAGLPLAIRICAARLAARSSWRIATLAGRLRNVHRRLDELKTGDLAVRASFQVSYDSLRTASNGIDPARAFRLLGLWAGTWISLSAAAALLGEPEDDVADVLEALVDINLLESPAPDQYRFHDLLRVYAMERASAEESDDARDAAVDRLLWWYLDSAQAAADRVSPQRYQISRPPDEAGYPALAFGTVDAALAWYDDERANLVAATRQAAGAGLQEVAWRLPPTLFPLFNRRGNWADCVTTHRVGADSAQKAGDRLGEAWALNQLGFALVSLRDPDAFGYLERALEIRQQLGDTRGEAQTAIVLGLGHLQMHGAGEDALRYLKHAAELLEPMGATSHRSVALNNLGEVYFALGDLDAAAQCYLQALEIAREFGSNAEGHALHNLGLVYLRQRRLAEATARLEEALLKHRASGALDGEAWTLKSLGTAQAEAGSVAAARNSLAGALRIFEQIGYRDDAAETEALLASLATGQGDGTGRR
ncbi:AfsR/SARP family transcriptional regulator [Trebonia kvetii]|uniref:AfsR/SARP family transcriptional regulator n=1 Tax=Trebonia kvetii TaxID=2480626 RepID=UPI001C9E970D|nr:BTAD domain-containing putative transcriptional regulator [Trebonia kvetii]